jgi:hypothetical protein
VMEVFLNAHSIKNNNRSELLHVWLDLSCVRSAGSPR